MNIVAPETVGMSSGGLERLDTAMRHFVEEDQLPGILTLVQRRGKVVHCGAFGMMDIEAQKPMRQDAIFRIYSMTKPLASVALMMLYEEGRFSIGDPVSMYVPAFKATKVYAGSHYLGMKLVEQDPPITIHHLLTHTAGLSYGWYEDSPVEALYREMVDDDFYDRAQPLKSLIERIAALPLLCQPGTAWRYSVATQVVGYLVQVLADMPFADFLEERIFRPLGMTDTAFHVPADKVHRLVQLYASDALYDPQVLEVAPAILDVTVPTQSPLGGSGLVSTAADYLRFCNCLINGGEYEGAHLISRKTLAWMTVNHIPAPLLPITIGPHELGGYGFGLGFRVMMDLGQARSLTSVGEYGWAGAAQTYFWIDPQEALIGLLMTQHMPLDDYPVQDRFRVYVCQSLVD